MVQPISQYRKPLLLVACDPVYAKKFLPAFLAGAAKQGYDTCVHLHFPSSQDYYHETTKPEYRREWELMEAAYSELAPRHVDLITSTGYLLDSEKADALPCYSSIRFRAALAAMGTLARPMFIMDVDSLVMGEIPFPCRPGEPVDMAEDPPPVGVFFRDPLPTDNAWERLGTHVAAGLLYVHPTASDFLKYVCGMVEVGPRRWFIDQVAIWTAAQWWRALHGEHSVGHLTARHLDWNFLPGTAVWTGKGPRKYHNPTYVHAMVELEDEFYEALRRCEAAVNG